MVDYDLKEIFKEPIFMDTIPEDIDLSEEKYDGISPYVPFIRDWNSNVIDIIYWSKPEKEREFTLKLLRKDSMDFIGRIIEVKKIKESDEFTVKLSNGVEVIFNEYILKKSNPDLKDKDLTDILEEIKKARLLYLNIIVKSKDKKNSKFYVKSYMDLAKVELRTKELLEIKQKYNVTWFDLFLCAISINPFDMNIDEYLLLRQLYIPRVLSLFPVKIRDEFTKYTHMLQFTKPGSGKSTFYSKLSNIMRIAIFGRFPSRTRLIMDARTGAEGAIFHNDYIVIDAFDKNLESQNFEEFLSISERGLGNGEWDIEKGSASTKSERDIIKRDVGFIFLGNVEKVSYETLTDLLKDWREWLKGELIKRGLNPGSVTAFIDRLAIISIVDQDFDVDKYIIDKTLRIQYFMAMINLIKQNILKAKIDNTKLSDLDKSRKRAFAKMLAKKIRALEISNFMKGNDPRVSDMETDMKEGGAEMFAKILVKGTWGWKSIQT
ncbi:MAG: BREX system Lon protease-like protein BrxL [Candidatus Nanopusillus sp.]